MVGESVHQIFSACAFWALRPLTYFFTYRIIPNKCTAPNKRAPPFSCTLYIQSAGLKKSTRHQPACSRVNIVEPRSVCCERGCKRGMLLLYVA